MYAVNIDTSRICFNSYEKSHLVMRNHSKLHYDLMAKLDLEPLFREHH